MLKLATLSFARPERMLQAYKEHISILETMEKGDIEHIYAITLKHKNIPDKISVLLAFHKCGSHTSAR